jgi:hypothetical protein
MWDTKLNPPPFQRADFPRSPGTVNDDAAAAIIEETAPVDCS